MIFGLILLVSASVATASTLKPCQCTRESNPMCGSDGVTYGNPCLFKCAQSSDSDLVLVKSGSCPRCACPYIHWPVCGSDGKTYPSRCVLECEPGVTFVKEGPCEQ